MKRYALLLAFVAFFSVTAAQAAIVTYTGIDMVSAHAAGPNASAARAGFDLAENPMNCIDFEDLPVGTLRADPYTAVPVAAGVSVQCFGSMHISAAYQGVTVAGNFKYGFNTTTGGDKHLGFQSMYYRTPTPGVTFTFDAPIRAWGAYLTGLERDIDGVVHVLFNDGAAHDIEVPEGDQGDDVSNNVQFFGFSSDQGFSAVTLELREVGPNRDIFGIDDMVYSHAPEPSILLLLSGGWFVVSGIRRAA